jgi:hypothetical protein
MERIILSLIRHWNNIFAGKAFTMDIPDIVLDI